MEIITSRAYSYPDALHLLVLQNNASRQVYAFTGIVDSSLSPVYRRFDLPEAESLPAGEYTYYVTRWNEQYGESDFISDVQPLESLVRVDNEKYVKLATLRPEMGIVKIGVNPAGSCDFYQQNIEYPYFDGK